MLIGATTINGILCRAARTAALYVPIYMVECGNKLSYHARHLVGSVAVPCNAVGAHG